MARKNLHRRNSFSTGVPLFSIEQGRKDFEHTKAATETQKPVDTGAG